MLIAAPDSKSLCAVEVVNLWGGMRRCRWRLLCTVCYSWYILKEFCSPRLDHSKRAMSLVLHTKTYMKYWLHYVKRWIQGKRQFALKPSGDISGDEVQAFNYINSLTATEWRKTQGSKNTLFRAALRKVSVAHFKFLNH